MCDCSVVLRFQICMKFDRDWVVIVWRKAAEKHVVFLIDGGSAPFLRTTAVLTSRTKSNCLQNALFFSTSLVWYSLVARTLPWCHLCQTKHLNELGMHSAEKHFVSCKLKYTTDLPTWTLYDKLLTGGSASPLRRCQSGWQCASASFEFYSCICNTCLSTRQFWWLCLSGESCCCRCIFRVLTHAGTNTVGGHSLSSFGVGGSSVFIWLLLWWWRWWWWFFDHSLSRSFPNVQGVLPLHIIHCAVGIVLVKFMRLEMSW